MSGLDSEQPSGCTHDKDITQVIQEEVISGGRRSLKVSGLHIGIDGLGSIVELVE